MFTFLIISDADSISASAYQAFSAIGNPEENTRGRLVVESANGMKDGWIAFQPIENIQYDYETEELEEIKTLISNPSFYLIEGRNGVVNFSNVFIQNFSPSGKVLIDNDHGMIADLAEVKGKIQSGEDWLYLSS
jgi:hypothetical protein